MMKKNVTARIIAAEIMSMIIAFILIGCSDEEPEVRPFDWSPYCLVVSSEGAGVEEALSAPAPYSKKMRLLFL